MAVVLPTAHSLGSESTLVDPIYRPSSDPDDLAVCNTDIRTTTVLRVHIDDKLLLKRDLYVNRRLQTCRAHDT